MKKTLIAFAAIVCMFGESGKAQVQVGINVGRPALPVVVAAEQVRAVSYYYLPDAEAYYYVPARRYYYYDDGAWVSRSYLPGKYRLCNAYSIRHIAVREPRPYRRHDYYRNKYPAKHANYYYSNEKEFGKNRNKKQGQKEKRHGRSGHN